MAATTHKYHTNGHSSLNIGAGDTIFGSIPRFWCSRNLLDGLLLLFDHFINKQIQYGCQNPAIAYFIVIDLHSAWGILLSITALLLSKISPKFDNESLAMILIGNIITGAVCFQTTYLQVALGILKRINKMLITELYEYSVCCSYYEV